MNKLNELFEIGASSKHGKYFVEAYLKTTGFKRLPEMTLFEEGIIRTIERTDLPCVQRLLTLGLVEGSSIKYIGHALSGSPIEIIIENSSRMCLLADCASHFFVEIKGNKTK